MIYGHKYHFHIYRPTKIAILKLNFIFLAIVFPSVIDYKKFKKRIVYVVKQGSLEIDNHMVLNKKVGLRKNPEIDNCTLYDH